MWLQLLESRWLQLARTFVKHVVKAGELYPVYLLAYYSASVIGVSPWMAVSRRLGKHRAFMACVVWYSIWACALPFVPTGNFGLFLFIMVLKGFSVAAMPHLQRRWQRILWISTLQELGNIEQGSTSPSGDFCARARMPLGERSRLPRSLLLDSTQLRISTLPALRMVILRPRYFGSQCSTP